MPSLRSEVVSVIEEICRPESPDLSDDARPLLESGLDSLDFASVLMALEDKFDVTIEEDDMEMLGSVGQLVSYLEGRVAA